MKVRILGGMGEISYSDHVQPGTCELLISGIFHLVFSGHSWPTVAEVEGNEMAKQG